MSSIITSTARHMHTQRYRLCVLLSRHGLLLTVQFLLDLYTKKVLFCTNLLLQSSTAVRTHEHTHTQNRHSSSPLSSYKTVVQFYFICYFPHILLNIQHPDVTVVHILPYCRVHSRKFSDC